MLISGFLPLVLRCFHDVRGRSQHVALYDHANIEFIAGLKRIAADFFHTAVQLVHIIPFSYIKTGTMLAGYGYSLITVI